MVRYADDNVFCFQFEEEAKAFYEAITERLKQFGLEISKEKSKIIAFGRKAEETNNDKGGHGGGKPETFDFLGFTHYCSKDSNGKFRVKRKTSRKKYRASLLRLKQWIRENRHMPKAILMETLSRKLLGYYRYYGITDNRDMVKDFLDEAKRYLFKYLNRRSRRRSYTWDKFVLFLKRYPLPKPKMYVSIFELRRHISYIL